MGSGGGSSLVGGSALHSGSASVGRPLFWKLPNRLQQKSTSPLRLTVLYSGMGMLTHLVVRIPKREQTRIFMGNGSTRIIFKHARKQQLYRTLCARFFFILLHGIPFPLAHPPPPKLQTPSFSKSFKVLGARLETFPLEARAAAGTWH